MPDKSIISVTGIGTASPEQSAPLYQTREPIVFPFSLTPLAIDGEFNRAALAKAMEGDRLLAFFPELPPAEELAALPIQTRIPAFSFQGKRRSGSGILVRVVKELKFPDSSTQILVRGIRRIRCSLLEAAAPVPMARFRTVPTAPADAANDPEIAAHQKNIMMLFQELAGAMPGLPPELQIAVFNAPHPERLADLVADALNFRYPEKLILLAMPELKQRFELLEILMNRELEVLRLGIKIQNEVQQAVGQSQREFFLREQLRTIQEELGEDSRNPDIIELEKRIQETELPEHVLEVVKKEMARLEVIPQAAPEYHIAYTYLTWLLDVPWLKFTDDRLDCKAADKVLDDDHYGLEDVKERILEFMAVLQLRAAEKQVQKAPILCLVGPPGVGKTSLGQSIARAMNRNFVRISLGGVRDEAEIRGHRRTYVGAMPGRIIQGLKKAGSGNPVFMLDEIDKLANDFRGDPASALLEVLDPAQNHAFNDHYLELDCDLSKIFFIATANVLDTIPGPLQDRMEIIRLPGYTSFEKREIARRYLVPRQIRECGLNPAQMRFQIGAINELIDHYTREAGVRQLERSIGSVCRKLARSLVETPPQKNSRFSISAGMVRDLLGVRKYIPGDTAGKTLPGCATGMAWTGVGGTILPIETILLPDGKGNLKLTGSLGKVMQESAETAFSLVRAHAAEWKIDSQCFQNCDFHIHVPDGATPKDGPSAGITLTLALLSLLTGKALRPYLSMTGEITLSGKVTAVGGIREKVIAALRAGIRQIIMPEENRKDLEEIPEEVQNKLEFFFVNDFRSAAAIAMQQPSRASKDEKKKPKTKTKAKNNSPKQTEEHK